MRVLFAPLDIANDASSLSRGERELGVEADLATIRQAAYGRPPDVDLRFRDRGSLARQLAKLRFVQGALQRYDVFHYAFGASILDYGDGPFALMDLKAAAGRGKCVAMTFHGCDVRPLRPGGCDLCGVSCPALRDARRLTTIREDADLLYVTTPDLLLAVPEASLLPASVWEIAATPVLPPAEEGPLRVVHAPSDRDIKGTRAVIEACGRLRASGLDIELTLIEGMPRERALATYREADVAVDQLRIGWYGVFAVELMAMGKPCVCRIDPEYVELSGMPAPPLIDASESTIAEVLAGLAEDRGSLGPAGAVAREFAVARHDAVANARRVVADYGKVIEARRSA